MELVFTSDMSNFKRMKVASGVTQTEPQISEPDGPNWLEMPDELMGNILLRSDTEEILRNAWRVCRTWRRICKDPAMWKVIDIQEPDYRSNSVYIEMLKPSYVWDTGYGIEMMTKHAIDLSSGELIDISLAGFGTDNLVDYILLRSSKLQRLCLKNCGNITGSGLSQAVERVPQLEKLHLSLVSICAQDIQVIGRNCPQLKSFTKNKLFPPLCNDDDALAIAKNMPELRHLQLFGNNMTNTGLQAILTGCPHLESLDLRRCFNLKLKGTERIKDFKHPYDSTENCGFHHRNLTFHDMFLSAYLRGCVVQSVVRGLNG